MITLRGITWNHSRGFLPMVATAQRFHETHPDVEIVWQKRTLQEFADFPIQKLAETFDLLVIDHPFVGYAATHLVLLPLDELLPADFLKDQADNSVGQSHASYSSGGHQWALAIDAATPVAAWRPDLLKSPPRTWTELLEFAKRGRVAVPGVAVDTLMHWFMLCIAEGETPFSTDGQIVLEAVGIRALDRLRELHAVCAPDCFRRNPIQTYEAMCAGDDITYCPFAYGYSNYARDGYARRRLAFGDLVDGLHSTLGGTGLAVSARCQYREVAAEYTRFVASPECQRSLYLESGGQPGHRAAWLDAGANRITHNFFHDTLPALDRAYLRPRYNGYLHFQDTAGPVVREYLMNGGDARATLRRLDELHRESHETT